MQARRQQGGWTFLIVLVALAIVGYLARDSILRYVGMLNRTPAAGDARLPPGAQPGSDVTQATPASSVPVERARAVEGVVRQQHEQMGKRIDAPR